MRNNDKLKGNLIRLPATNNQKKQQGMDEINMIVISLQQQFITLLYYTLNTLNPI